MQRVSLTFSAAGPTYFHKRMKRFELNFLKRKNALVDSQTRQAKSSMQPVNLPHAWPLMRPLTWRLI